MNLRLPSAMRVARPAVQTIAFTGGVGGLGLQGPTGVTVVPGASGVMQMATTSQNEHAGLIGLFSDLPIAADTLIVNLATGLSESVLSFCRAGLALRKPSARVARWLEPQKYCGHIEFFVERIVNVAGNHGTR